MHTCALHALHVNSAVGAVGADAARRTSTERSSSFQIASATTPRSDRLVKFQGHFAASFLEDAASLCPTLLNGGVDAPSRVLGARLQGGP